MQLNEFLSDLKTLISYQSVNANKTPTAPFGKENFNALSFFLNKAEEFGFETVNYDNYAGEIIFGANESNLEEIGVIGHLDVVPASSIGWDSDPFTLTEKDGFLFGRGVSDDKGPSLLILYALKELKDNKILPKRKIRFFVGCNEEDGWADLDYLKTKTTLPEYGFSPDGNFPLSYAEKGVYQLQFKFPALKNFYEIKGGSAVNAVCDYASAKSVITPDNALLKEFSLGFNGEVIESFGKAAHGSMPHLGKNAIKPLVQYFGICGENTLKMEKLFDGLELSALKNEQGEVTFSPNVITSDNKNVYITCDCRIPAPLCFDDVKKIIDGFGYEYKHLPHTLPPVLVEKDGWLVQTLLNAYNTVTGENKQPVSLCGSTFARAFKKGCAFGIEFGRYQTNIHDANERIKISEVLEAYEIYLLALKNLVLDN